MNYYVINTVSTELQFWKYHAHLTCLAKYTFLSFAIKNIGSISKGKKLFRQIESGGCHVILLETNC